MSQIETRPPQQPPAEGEHPTAILVDGVTKKFGKRTVLDQIKLNVREGETLVILGGSGSGKSTLLRLMIGNLMPDGGEVIGLGKCLSSMTDEELAALLPTAEERKEYDDLKAEGMAVPSRPPRPTEEERRAYEETMDAWQKRLARRGILGAKAAVSGGRVTAVGEVHGPGRPPPSRVLVCTAVTGETLPRSGKALWPPPIT